jgi:hypothetical protein
MSFDQASPLSLLRDVNNIMYVWRVVQSSSFFIDVHISISLHKDIFNLLSLFHGEPGVAEYILAMKLALCLLHLLDVSFQSTLYILYESWAYCPQGYPGSIKTLELCLVR